jgi:transcriptional antiterminator RfaH
MSYWSVARLQLQREGLALHCLSLNGFTTYLPRLRVRKMMHGRRITVTPPLFPGYLFIAIQNGRWWDARWSPGIISLILDHDVPARLPDAVIDEIKRRETGGLITLERQGIKRGDKVRILRGPFKDHLAIYSDSRPRDRIEVLLQLLGGAQPATLESLDVKLVD